MSGDTYNTPQTSAQVIRAIANYCGRADQSGNDWKCKCPICGRHSLSLTPKLFKLVYCHHCASNGINDGYSEQRKIFVDAGLLEPAREYKRLSAKEYEEYCTEKRTAAQHLWDLCEPIRQGCAAAKYLQARGIGSFNGHRALRTALTRHPCGDLCIVLAARLIHVNFGICAVQLTYLQGDDRARDLNPGRITHGSMKGGAVWVGRPQLHEEVVVAEGLETCLSAMLLLNLKCGAAVCGPHMKNLVLPRNVRNVHIAADNDETGRGAAECTAKMWRNRGLKVRVSVPDKEGEDFNDVWLRQCLQKMGRKQ